MILKRYTIFGVPFDADLDLALPEARGGEEVRFQLRAAPQSGRPPEGGRIVQQEDDEWVRWCLFDDGYVEIEWKNWLQFRIDPEGRHVHYVVREARYPNAFEAYVANFAVSVCLLLQGEELLHSTVVRHRGLGIAFLGHSGAGKSTMTAHFISHGAELVTDDMLRITDRQGRLYAEPGQPRLKLFAETAKIHLPMMANKGRWNPVSQKYLFDTAPPRDLRMPCPLDALILLAPPVQDHPEDVTMRRLEGLELFQALTASTMNSRLQTGDRLARQFAFAKRVAEKLPVYALHYPRRHDIFPDIVRTLEQTLPAICTAR